MFRIQFWIGQYFPSSIMDSNMATLKKRKNTVLKLSLKLLEIFWWCKEIKCSVVNSLSIGNNHFLPPWLPSWLPSWLLQKAQNSRSWIDLIKYWDFPERFKEEKLLGHIHKLDGSIARVPKVDIHLYSHLLLVRRWTSRDKKQNPKWCLNRARPTLDELIFKNNKHIVL